jgi:alpha-tubulin suppressor-like RCC1 family protein
MKLPIRDVISVACGAEHTIVLNSNGVYVCGSNISGQISLDMRLTREWENNGKIRWNSMQKVTLPVDFLEKDIKTIACGGYHTFILTHDGRLYCCGDNSFGQLGLMEGEESLCERLTKNDSLCDVAEIGCGLNHTIIMDSNGQFYSAGNNEKSQLGREDSADSFDKFTF